jgi:catechol 2,3-dioxygenase-like lactoylglutathione lyase family enzyme
MAQQADLLGVYLFVRDLDATLGFYNLLGLSVERISPVFARATMPNGSAIEFGCAELTRSYDPNWQEPTGPGTNTINFELSSRAAVDATYAALVAAGYTGHLAPCDPLWQARFALIDDPDGNIVGLHSPRDREAERSRENE